jgi:hypothetical protein
MVVDPVPGTVKVTLHLEPDVAEMLLRDDALRARVGRFVSRLLSRPGGTAAADPIAELRGARTSDGPEPTDGA